MTSTYFQFLLIISSIGAGLSLLALGTYTYMNSLGYYVQPFSWIAIASFSSMLFLASCGIIPLPYVILSEIMPHKVSGTVQYCLLVALKCLKLIFQIKSIGATVCFCLSWITAFVMLKCFPLVVIWIGVHGCIYFFATCCFLGKIIFGEEISW